MMAISAFLLGLLSSTGPATLQLMLRPFYFRDSALVHRLSERGVLLQAETALTTSPRPLRSALINKLIGGTYSTFVWRSEDGEAAAFVQLSWEQGEPSAHLACLGVENGRLEEGQDKVDEDVWLPLLEQLVVQAGNNGVHNLIAEASESGPELPVLRRAGFAVYTRQDIWISEQPSEGDPPDILRAREPVDDWDIHVLYSNIVPRLIQSVEPGPPLDNGQNWVLREEGELAALVHIHVGPVASWMRLLIHPNAHIRPNEIIRAALSQKEPSAEHPVYCSVRRYQSWLQGSLERAGFRHWGSQAVMVKHIAQRVDQPAQFEPGALKSQTVASSPPLVQGFSHPTGNGRQNH